MITASIVTYKNSPEECRTILNCLLSNSIDRIFVIDHSPDSHLASLVAVSDKVEYIRHANLGYGAGHNVGIRRAFDLGADYHLVVNADVVADGNVVPELVSYMDQNPDVAQIMPNVFYPNGDRQYLCKLLPSPWVMFVRRFMPLGVRNRINEKFTLKFTGYDRLVNAPYLSGCFMLFRCSALREVGLFDERFFMYAEDIDLTRRMHERYRTIFYPRVSIVHVHRAESRHSFKMLKVHIVSLVKYFNKWGWLFDRQRRRFNRQVLEELGCCK